MHVAHRIATELNGTLERDCPSVFSMLSVWGKAAYFPKDGILGQSAEAKGKDINATIGSAFDDDGAPMHIDPLSSLTTLDSRDVLPYAPSHGLPELRQEWTRQMREKNPSMTFPTSLPVVTAGLTHGLRIAGELLVDPDDRLIIPEPLWGNYPLVYPQADIRTFPFFSGSSFNVDGLRKALHDAPKKAVLVLNFPNNPAGYVPAIHEAAQIADVLRDVADTKHIAVILDDAYFGLVYEDGIDRESLMSRLGNVHENVLVAKVDGSSKEDFAWGLRVAYLTYASKGLSADAATALEEKTAGLVRGSVSNACHLSQSMLLRAYADPLFWKQKKANEAVLRRRFKEAKKHAQNSGGLWELLPCNAGYFLCLKLSRHLDAEVVRKKLLDDGVGVIALPGNLLRIAYCSVPEAQIGELFSRIRKTCG